jgi:hypothetical protein
MSEESSPSHIAGTRQNVPLVQSQIVHRNGCSITTSIDSVPVIPKMGLCVKGTRTTPFSVNTRQCILLIQGIKNSTSRHRSWYSGGRTRTCYPAGRAPLGSSMAFAKQYQSGVYNASLNQKQHRVVLPFLVAGAGLEPVIRLAGHLRVPPWRSPNITKAGFTMLH